MSLHSTAPLQCWVFLVIHILSLLLFSTLQHERWDWPQLHFILYFPYFISISVIGEVKAKIGIFNGNHASCEKIIEKLLRSDNERNSFSIHRHAPAPLTCAKIRKIRKTFGLGSYIPTCTLSWSPTDSPHYGVRKHWTATMHKNAAYLLQCFNAPHFLL